MIFVPPFNGLVYQALLQTYFVLEKAPASPGKTDTPALKLTGVPWS